MCNIIYKFTLLSLHLLINFFLMRTRSQIICATSLINHISKVKPAVTLLDDVTTIQYHKGGKFLKKLWCCVGGEV